MKNVNIQNSLLRVYSFICNLRVRKTVVELFMQGILIMRKKNILPHCDNVTGALKEQRGGSSKCLCGFQLPPKIWEEENKIFPQDLLQCMYILSFTYCNFMYLCPSFSLISSFPTNGSGNAKHFDTKCDKKILSKYSIKEKKEIQIYDKILKYMYNGSSYL